MSGGARLPNLTRKVSMSASMDRNSNCSVGQFRFASCITKTGRCASPLAASKRANKKALYMSKLLAGR